MNWSKARLFASQHRILLLMLMVTGLAAVRLPTVWFRMGGQDEGWYTVPGWTVANEGIPRIPYVPTDDPDSVFQGADRILYALPPAYFYLQAPFFWLFEPGYGTARLATVFAGACALIALYSLMRSLGVRPIVALLGLPLCGLARAYYFPWQDSRPDLLCAAFGLAALAVSLSAVRLDNNRLVSLSGFLIGMGALTHPYAIVVAIQVGCVLLLTAVSWRQAVLRGVLCGLATLSGLALWLPLIAMDGELFWAQFATNVLSRSGPGLTSRLLWPWPFFPEQGRLIIERLGIYQLSVLGAACLVGAVLAFKEYRNSRPHDSPGNSHVRLPGLLGRGPVLLAWLLVVSGLYLHVACLGMHPAKGYLCYPWALLVLLLACMLEELAGRTDNQAALKEGSEKIPKGNRFLGYKPARLVAVGLCFALLLMLLIPGSGIRATLAYTLRNDELNYNRQAFCHELNQQIPPDAKLLVSPEYVFEFELLGRKPVNASRLALYHDVKGLPFDYLIASTQAFDEGLVEYLRCELAWEFGDPQDELACYVQVLKPTPETPVTKNWPRP